MITKEILQTGEAVISRPEVVLLKAWFKNKAMTCRNQKGRMHSEYQPSGALFGWATIHLDFRF